MFEVKRGGREGWKRRIIKEYMEIFERDGNVYWFDCDCGFTGVDIY